jgi:hypothetical protein
MLVSGGRARRRRDDDERTPKTMTDRKTVHAVTYDLLREIELTTVFGNPHAGEPSGSRNLTEELG